MQKINSAFLFHPVHFLALGFGTGCVPRVPGTAGTLAGVLIYFLLHNMTWYFYLAITLLLFVSGIWICGRTARDLGVHDHGAIVWDEIVGYLVTMIVAPGGWIWLLTGFLFFRLYDIWKPWPVAWADAKVAGGLGIMLDDLIAGIYALISVQFISHVI